MRTLLIDNISQDRFGRIKNKLRESGIELSGNQGQVAKFGAKIFYDYFGGTLKVDIESAPLFTSIDHFADEIEKNISSVQ